MCARTNRNRWLLVLLVLCGCGRQGILADAIARRGGALTAVTRVSTVEIRQGYPGTWASRMTFAVPDRYAWSYDTTSEPYHYLFDGSTVRAFVGMSMVAEDASPTAALRSHANFTAVLLLAGLDRPGVRVTSNGPGQSRVVLADGATYQLTFDAGGDLQRVDGPLDLPGIAAGAVTATLSDYRDAGGRRWPYRIQYVVGGQEFADERVQIYCEHRAGLPDATFQSVAALPRCP